MSLQVGGPFLCEVDATASTPVGTAEQIGAYNVQFSETKDVERLQVGTILLFEGDAIEYKILEINAAGRSATLDQNPGLTGPTDFTYRRMPLIIRERAAAPEPREGFDEFLRGYFDSDGTYHPTGEGAFSGCILSDTNSAPQVLTPNTQTLVTFDSTPWWNPSDEWGGGGSTPNLFTPLKAGIYAIWASFHVLATTSAVGDRITGSLALSVPTYYEVSTVVHQRPDLDFVPTYRRNIDLQALTYMIPGYSVGAYITSQCAVSEISNTYISHFGACRLSDTGDLPGDAAQRLAMVRGGANNDEGSK